jgi:plastocyanin
MRFGRNLLALAMVSVLAFSATAVAGTVSGTVKFEGTAPKLRPLKMDADPGCAKKHSGPVMSEMLVLGDGNTMANIFIRVKGVPGTHPAPSEPTVMDQNGCQYRPHVMGVMVGQKFLIKNSDGLLHNVHSLAKINQAFNRAMPGAVTEAEFSFDKEELMFKIKCDVHPWMSAYVGVMTHPFYDVTGEDGKFEIKGVPAGTYEVEAWHEKLGTKTASVTVGDSDTQTLDFSLSVPKK